MFYDRLTIIVRAGRGGDGSSSFRREAHVPRGGADGGDGGKGGDVTLRADASRRDLAHLRRKREYAAGNGGPGAKRQQHGKDGTSLIIDVPIGTQAFDVGGAKLCDLVTAGQQMTVAVGGGGGRGNTHFVSPVRRAPTFAEVGMPGEETEIELRLKLMADAALVGHPNAGKSSLLARVSNAKPKVASYPFTTLEPVLGTLERSDGRQIVVADVPGLLEGASEGHGLGHEFLAHLERARLLVHLVSLEEPETVAARLSTVQRELFAYSPAIANLPQIVALSKADLVDDETIAAATVAVKAELQGHRERMGPLLGVQAISSATGFGLADLVQKLFDNAHHTEPHRPTPLGRSQTATPLEEYRVYRPQPRRRWRLVRDKEGLKVTGDPTLQKLAEQAADDEAAQEKLWQWLSDSGALQAIEQAGARPGATITVCETTLIL